MITFTKSSGSKSTISFMKRGRDGTSNVVNEGNFRSCFPAQQKHKLVSLSPRVIIHTIMRKTAAAPADGVIFGAWICYLFVKAFSHSKYYLGKVKVCPQS